MALPTVDVPVYELTLPSDGKKIKYHPFTMKEKKLFLLIKESADVKDVVETVKQVVQNCIVKPEIDVDELPIIDMELLFVHLRARSMGEVVELDFICQNPVPQEDGSTKPCNAPTAFRFNLLEAKVEENPLHDKAIKINDKIGIVMKYPTFAMSKLLESDINDPDVLLRAIVDSIDYIYDTESTYPAKSYKKEELVAWVESLEQSAFDKMKVFFDTAPKIVGQSQFKCNKCGYTEDVKLDGLIDFFG